jgi:hypothetical protein
VRLGDAAAAGGGQPVEPHPRLGSLFQRRWWPVAALSAEAEVALEKLKLVLRRAESAT